MIAIINTALLRVHVAILGLRARLAEERGQDLLEYALWGGLIALALVIIAVVAMQTAIGDMVEGIGNCIDFSSGTTCDPGP